MDDTKSLSYFFLGLGLGVAVGMIFAPQAGAETRTLIRNRATEGGEAIRRKGSEIADGATGLLDKGKDVLGRQREQLNAAVEAGRSAYREAVGRQGESPAEMTPSEGI